MPLIGDRKSMETMTVEVDGDTYTLVTQISGHKRDEIRAISVGMSMPRSEIDGNDPDSPVYMKLNHDKSNFLLKQYFIVEWSHSERLTAANLKLMPAHHDDAVLEAIKELMPSQNGAEEDSPLVEQSPKS